MTAIEIEPVPLEVVQPLRELYRHAMHCQIIHDSLPRRGFGQMHRVRVEGRVAGYGFVMGYRDEPVDLIREFFLLPAYQAAALPIFRQLIAATGATRIETQTNDALLTLLIHDCATDITTERILFHDAMTTSLPDPGVTFRAATPDDAARVFEHGVEPVGDWVLEREGTIVATGGFLTHYNVPYADLYMEVAGPRRRLGYGSYLIQELKRVCYESGLLPAARCDVANAASRATLQKAGLLPCARTLLGRIPTAGPAAP